MMNETKESHAAILLDILHKESHHCLHFVDLWC